MSGPAVENIEGRLNAHRRLLVSILSILADHPSTRIALQRLLRENESVSDHEEDPGIDPDGAFAIQGEANGEVTSILRDAMARSNATRQQG